ncbi:MAG: protein kinase [Acidobacteria bacterium]|nr:protein kinase [Acidobacteriota bacterium]MBK8148531.1 protein kinase [Acidobacteriota bacterium]MBK8813179.1 protein kinase [Acidobacteriota bacterium]
MLLVNELLNNRYRIVRQLGHGGMGAVYEAQDSVFDTTCAIKEIMIDTAKAPSAQQQELIKSAFEREAKLLAKIKHEVVPHVRDYFSHDSRQFLVMELVEGKDFGELMEDRKVPFPVEDVVRWMLQLLDALDYLHTQNPPIYHRDIKPQNLKMTPRGKIKLLDFGIAKGGAPEPANSSSIGNQTFVAATLNYSPIEQTYRVLDPVFREVLLQRFESRIKVVMDQAADARSDIYALGATAYHMLTGTLPIDSLKRTTEVWSGKQDPLANPASLNSQVPPALANLLMKSMEIDRDNRFPSALEMELALKEAMGSTADRPITASSEAAPTFFQAFDTEPEARVPSVTDAPTMQIPADQIGQQFGSPISEQTIQIQPPAGSPFNTGGQQPPPTGSQFNSQQPIGSPFNTGGQPQPPPTGGQFDSQQPVASPFNTGGQQPIGSPFNTGGQQQSATNQFNTGGQPQNSDPIVIPSGSNTGQPGTFGAAAFAGGQQFASPAAAPKKRGKALFIVIPLLALLFLAVGGAGAGYWIWNQSQTVTASPTPTATPASTVSPSPSSTEKATKTETPTPTVSPTASPSETKTVTTVPTTVKTPPVKTQKPKTPAPKRNSDCIFTGDC